MNELEFRHKPLAIFSLIGVIAVTLILVVHFSTNVKNGPGEAAVVKAISSKHNAENPKAGVHCDLDKNGNATMCDDHSGDSLEHQKFTFDYDSALKAVQAANLPHYTTRKNADNSVTFYLNGVYAAGDTKSGPCKTYNPYPGDSSKGTYILTDSPACAAPGQDFTTVEINGVPEVTHQEVIQQ